MKAIILLMDYSVESKNNSRTVSQKGRQEIRQILEEYVEPTSVTVTLAAVTNSPQLEVGMMIKYGVAF